MLDYLALGLLLAVLVILASAVVALFDLPYRIAARRWALTVPSGGSDSRPT
jgi:hypothetical protein